MMKRETPKRVTLRNGKTFVARYEHATRDHLPANIHQKDLTNKEQRHAVDVAENRNLFSKVETLVVF